MLEYFLIALLVLVDILVFIFWPRTITIEDKQPEITSEKNNWLQLQNEGGKYVRVKDGKVYLKIVK